MHRLFRDFAYRIKPYTQSGGDPIGDGVSHVLEGSVRVMDERMRASFRLIEAETGAIRN